MPATKSDIAIEQGATFRLDISFVDSDGEAIDLTGYTARMQVRETYEATTVVLEATTANGYIIVDGPNGIVSVRIPPSATEALAVAPGVYDVEVESSSGEVDRLVQGTVSVSPEVTR